MKYRNKPVVIEAVVWGGPQDFDAVYRINSEGRYIYPTSDGKLVISTNTTGGDVIAEKGDYVIRGVKGELSVMKRDLFEASFEAVK